ncbi:MAG: putative ABC transporter ATP-binding protein YfiL [Herpetosiphonaceae bacterium]|nr:MAG: putative ABC transporter ATP-binding protein YfiL [Herpetosiphonaceae bacterium]
MGAILEARELVKSFGDVRAVKGVTFAIEEGEIFSLLGPNGAGKTTTISMLSGLIKPTSGDAVIAGYSISREPNAVKRAIGVVPQEIALYETLSARENLFFWGRMYGLGGALLKRRVAEVLDMIGLTERADHKVATYSGGMKRRVNIGVGLLHGPKIIYMDEPTVGIDPQSRRNILDAVKELNRQGMTVLYTTHYMEEAEELSHRVGIIDHGELIALGTQQELTRMVGEEQTLKLHLGEDENPTPLVEALSKLPTVTKATASAEPPIVTVILPEIKESLAQIIGTAHQLDVRIRSVDIEEPNLEAVFLHLTGRALRD